MIHKKVLSVILVFALMVSTLLVSSVSIVTPVKAAGEEFQIGVWFPPTWSYTNSTQYDYLRDANINLVQTSPADALALNTIDRMNTLLGLASARGIQVQASDSRSTTFTNASADAIANTYKDNPATGGYFIADEPGEDGLQICASMYRRYLLNDPDSVPYVNLYPIAVYGTDYTAYLKNYVNGWIDAVGSDSLKYLTFDNYAYQVGSTIKGDYYQNLAYIRNAGLSRNVKTSCYLQSVGMSSGLRVPTAHEARLDAYTAVAYGMKGIYWFTWFQPQIVEWGFTPAIMDQYGNKTSLYTPIQTINGEIKKLGPTLMGLTSRDVFFRGVMPDASTPVPANYFWLPTTNYNQIISHFTDQSNRSYIMVVNRDYTNSRTLSFNLTSKPTAVTEVSKSTGAEVATNYSSSTGNISASFLPGEGKLFAISTDYKINSLTADDKDATITYSGTGWGYSANRGYGDYENDLHYTTVNNDFFQYSFYGTGIDYITEKSPGLGNVDIYIDGVFDQTISCEGTVQNQAMQTVYSKKGLTYGAHTIKGVKKSGSYMCIDNFKVHLNSLTVDDKDAAITYSGTNWIYSANRGLGEYEGDLHSTSANNDSFHYSFNGTGIDYVSVKAPGLGDIDIYIDGVFQKTVNCNSTINNQVQQTVFRKTGLANGVHTIKGVKKSGTYMNVDYFKVYTDNNTCNITRTNDTSASTTYSGSGWGYDRGRNLGDYGDDLHYTAVNNDYFEHTFTGTSVNYITEKTPGNGDVDIYIDGVFQQTVSCNGTINNQPQQAVFSKTGLTYGTHVLKGVKKSGAYMCVDGF